MQKALRRASRRAFMWPEEAAALLEQGRSLTELAGVGPHLERIIGEWLESPPELPEPPPLRAGFLSIPAARALLAAQPAWADRLRGDLQTHSQWSDGTGTIAEMAGAAAPRNYEDLAITDHAQSLKIAGRINARQLRRQEPRTERYVRALRHPDIQILGHPRGRIYIGRLGLAADWPRVFDVAPELDKAVEIDAYPDRQDLSSDLVRLAKRAGCRISLGTDAHGPTQLGFIELGLASALRAGVRPDRIVNFLPRAELDAWVRSLRETARH